VGALLIEHDIDAERMRSLGIEGWPIWSCGVEEFPWMYAEKEVGYIIEGEVIVTPDEGESVTIKAGDLVTFPAGMSCRWNVVSPLRKHYTFP